MNVPLYLSAREDDIRRFLPLLFKKGEPLGAEDAKRSRAMSATMRKGRAIHRRPASSDLPLSMAVQRLVAALPRQLAAPLQRPLRRFGRHSPKLRGFSFRREQNNLLIPKVFKLRWARRLHRIQLARRSSSVISHAVATYGRSKTVPVGGIIKLLHKRSVRLSHRSRTRCQRRHSRREEALRWGKPILKYTRIRNQQRKTLPLQTARSPSSHSDADCGCNRNNKQRTPSLYLPSHALLRRRFQFALRTVQVASEASTSTRRSGVELLGHRILVAEASIGKRRRKLAALFSRRSGNKQQHVESAQEEGDIPRCLLLHDASSALMFVICSEEDKDLEGWRGNDIVTMSVPHQRCTATPPPLVEEDEGMVVEDVVGTNIGTQRRVLPHDSRKPQPKQTTFDVCRWIEASTHGAIVFDEATHGDGEAPSSLSKHGDHHAVLMGAMRRLPCSSSGGASSPNQCQCADEDDGEDVPEWSPCQLMEIVSGRQWLLVLPPPPPVPSKKAVRDAEVVVLPSLLFDVWSRPWKQHANGGFTITATSSWLPSPNGARARTAVFSVYVPRRSIGECSLESIRSALQTTCASAVQRARELVETSSTSSRHHSFLLENRFDVSVTTHIGCDNALRSACSATAGAGSVVHVVVHAMGATGSGTVPRQTKGRRRRYACFSRDGRTREERFRGLVFFTARHVHRALAMATYCTATIGEADLAFILRQLCVPSAYNVDFIPLGCRSTLCASDLGVGNHHPVSYTTDFPPSSSYRVISPLPGSPWGGSAVGNGRIVPGSVVVAIMVPPAAVSSPQQGKKRHTASQTPTATSSVVPVGIVTHVEVQNLLIGQPTAMFFVLPTARTILESSNAAAELIIAVMSQKTLRNFGWLQQPHGGQKARSPPCGALDVGEVALLH